MTNWLTTLAIPSALVLSAGMAFANPQISLEEAATLAQASHRGFIVEVELEDDDRRWDVEFADDTELKVDARTGDLTRTDRGDDRTISLPDGVISVWNAVAIAVGGQNAIARSVVPNSEPIEAELEFDDGRLTWEVEFRNDTEVNIDALSGAILEIDD